MAERLIKTIKHGMTVLSAAPNNANCWDEQLAKVMFGYRCEIQSSTKFSPFMILTGHTPRLRADKRRQLSGSLLTLRCESMGSKQD
jgi:hypothetical protein